MTSPLLRLFAVFWWLLVVGSAGVALFGTWAVWENYLSSYASAASGSADDPYALMLQKYLGTDHPPGGLSWHVAACAVALSLLLFIALTITRWIITGRWRFGPRW